MKGKITLALALLVLGSSAVDAKKRKAKTKPSPLNVEEKVGAQDFCVWDADLVSHATSAKQIVEHHQAYHEKTSRKLFKGGPTLGFVTPWNRKGYKFASKFGCKLDYVSPVWYVVRWEDQDVKVSGQHEHDAKWIAGLKELKCEPDADGNPRSPKILPRFRWEIGDHRAVHNVLMFPKSFAQAVAKVLEEYEYDGLVIEMWRELAAMGLTRSEQGRQSLHKMHKVLGEHVHELNKLMIAVIPPVYASITEHGLTEEQEQEAMMEVQPADIKILKDDVDHFLAMTYDWGAREPSGGANAPVPWVGGNLAYWLGEYEGEEAKQMGRKVLIGVSFYGMEYCKHGMGRREPVLGSSYIDILKKYNPTIEWDNAYKEHYFRYRSEEHGLCTVWYPTLQSLESHLQVAKEYHAGVGIWEAGQGLDYFADLL